MMSNVRILSEDEVQELDRFVARNDIMNDFDDIVTVQECYNNDVRELIATIRDRDKTIADYTDYIHDYEAMLKERDEAIVNKDTVITNCYKEIRRLRDNNTIMRSALEAYANSIVPTIAAEALAKVGDTTC